MSASKELIGMGAVREMLDGLPVTTEWMTKHAHLEPVGVFGNNSALYDKARIERFVQMFRMGVEDAAFYAAPVGDPFRIARCERWLAMGTRF